MLRAETQPAGAGGGAPVAPEALLRAETQPAGAGEAAPMARTTLPRPARPCPRRLLIRQLQGVLAVRVAMAAVRRAVGQLEAPAAWADKHFESQLQPSPSAIQLTLLAEQVGQAGPLPADSDLAEPAA